MLAMSDTNIEIYLPIFAGTGAPVAFLVPTPTGYKKCIMDATGTVRELLKSSGIHDYELQPQGQKAKRSVPAFFVTPDGLIETTASLYRPQTKKGDPRIWFSGLRTYCSPCNLLALTVSNKEIYVFNLSDSSIQRSLINHEAAYDILNRANDQTQLISEELLGRLKEIHRRGFLPSITHGDPGVGDTLENALGIRRNNMQAPDYKGIELKTTRLTRGGRLRKTTRQTLFSKVPDIGMTYREILENFGKKQIPRGKTVPRFQLVETCRCSRPNAYGLMLAVNHNANQLELLYIHDGSQKFVSAWAMQMLQETLLNKHRETFWVKASAEIRDGREYFRYDKVLHTRNPNGSLLAPLLETDKITVDLLVHRDLDGTHYRDHGLLFKMEPEDLHLLMGDPVEYVL